MCPVRCSSFARPSRAAAALAAVLLAGCKVDAAVTLEADSDGTGDVTATVTFDEAAAAEVGPLEDHVHVEDLRDAGWTVILGERVVTATKSYDHPDEASEVLQEVGGALVSRARVTRSETFAKTTTDVDVELDLTRGIEVFSDTSVTEQLGGLPPGFDPKDLSVSFTAETPGEAAVTVDVPLGEKVAVASTGSDFHVTRLVAAAAAPVLSIAAVVLFLRRRGVPVPVTPDP